MQTASAAKKAAPRVTPYGDWVEPGFPFFSSILDARDPANEVLTNNITPRGLVLNLGDDHWACFDTDLLRMSAIWRGAGVTVEALAPRSYHPWGGKSRGGLFPAPAPLGEVIYANGIYPGWQLGRVPVLTDPREPAPDPNEVGRGPLPEKLGRMQAVRLVGETVVLEYTAGDSRIREWVTQAGGTVVRHFQIEPGKEALVLVLGVRLQGQINLAADAGKRPARLRSATT